MFAKYTTMAAEELAADYGVDIAHGLTDAAVDTARQTYGRNELAQTSFSVWRVFLRQFTSPFVYLLAGASALAFLLGEQIDGSLILLFIIINTVLGFHQEYKSEHAVKLLKRYVVARARVRRNGKETLIPAHDLVPGDVVIVEAGDIIPADIRFAEEENLLVDESPLTGESVPIAKTGRPLKTAMSEIYQAMNIGFSGTTTVGGKGAGIVFAIGKATVMGGVNQLTTETKRASSFELGIHRLSIFILRLILFTLAFVFAINVFLKGLTVDTVIPLIIFSIALAVSVIPEALPVVTTFSLSRGALRLAKHHVVVKRLSAIEDLGGVNVLCTDKTGTLTENVLAIEGVYPRHDVSNDAVIHFAALASPFLAEKNKEPNNSFDLALWARLDKKEKKTAQNAERVREIPFEPERRRNTVLVKTDDRELTLISRGAPEVILDLCAGISKEAKRGALAWMAGEGEHGRRVLAVAKKSLVAEPGNLGKAEVELEFLGLISFSDPLKSSAKSAIQKAKRLGVQVKIITGDSADVAGAVGCQVGLTASCHEVLNAGELDAMHHEEQLAAVEKYNVFARVSPEQKYRIIQLLQKTNTVGFLGEGINDAPSLKIAHVGIVVAEASDIAREAADIVLLRQSLGVIIDGIQEGREVFANTIKYIKATLASNLGNFYAVAVSTFFIDYLPMLPVQLLLVNLLSDFPMIAIATDTVDKNEVTRPRTYDIKDIALFAMVIGAVSTLFDFLFFGIFYQFGPQVLQTNWFIGSILTELIFILSVRTHLPFWRAKLASPVLLGLSGAAFIATILLPLTSFGQRIFQFVAPTAPQIILILIIIALYFVITECVKLLYYKFINGKPKLA